MQEEVTQKTIALVIKAAKLDGNVLRAAMRAYLNQRRQHAQNHAQPHVKHGKMAVRDLIGQGAGVSTIDISDGKIKDFERIARKYGVDFAIKKDKTVNPPKYVVFFKGKDADAIAQAFKEFVYGNEKKKEERPSVRQKLRKLVESLMQNKNRDRTRDKHKERETSL